MIGRVAPISFLGSAPAACRSPRRGFLLAAGERQPRLAPNSSAAASSQVTRHSESWLVGPQRLASGRRSMSLSASGSCRRPLIASMSRARAGATRGCGLSPPARSRAAGRTPSSVIPSSRCAHCDFSSCPDRRLAGLRPLIPPPPWDLLRTISSFPARGHRLVLHSHYPSGTHLFCLFWPVFYFFFLTSSAFFSCPFLSFSCRQLLRTFRLRCIHCLLSIFLASKCSCVPYTTECSEQGARS